MSDSDPHDLSRFVEAQDRGVHERAVAELRAGTKRSHWMWFVFPQLRGLGRSSNAHRYGIADAREARAYLAHPVLGPRLREATHAILSVRDRDATTILGRPDDAKLRSCLTLFVAAADDEADRALFRAGLARFYAGRPDPATLELLGA